MLCVTFLVAASTSHAQPLPGSFYLRGSVGVATQSLKDWNDDIRADEQFLQSQGVPASFDEFGTGFPIGIEGGFHVSDIVSFGAALTYQKASVNNMISDASGSLTSIGDVSLSGVVATASVRIPEAQGLLFGANVGIGFGTARSETHFRDFVDPANNFDVTANWDGNAPIFGAFAGYDRFFPNGKLISLKIGYQFQNLGEFDGTVAASSLQLASASYLGALPLRESAGVESKSLAPTRRLSSIRRCGGEGKRDRFTNPAWNEGVVSSANHGPPCHVVSHPVELGGRAGGKRIRKASCPLRHHRADGRH
jgi:hypothetical protein